MIRNIILFTLWLIVWLLLSWPPDLVDLFSGAVVSVIVSLVTLDIFSAISDTGKKAKKKKTDLLGMPMKLLWFLVYVFVFLLECLKANIDVAYRVLHPNLPIRPGTIRVKTSLKSDTGLTFLANSVTLTPGTTSVDVDKDRGYLYVHWLYVKDGYDVTSETLPVVDKFEKILKRIFE